MFSFFVNTIFSNFSKNILLNMFIYTENYTESHTNIEEKYYNTKHTQNTQIHFQQSIFLKYISFGLPGSLWKAFKLQIDLPT